METLPQLTRCAFRSADDLASSGTMPHKSTWDRTTQDVILRRHGARLYNLARRFTANDSDARDLVQDTFETSLRKLPAELPPESIGCWLAVTLRNRFVDQRRRSFENRIWVTSLDSEILNQPAPKPDEEPRWTRIEAEDLWCCANRLKPGLREVFLLRACDKRSHAEIAAQLGISLSTVGTRYFRALRCLRRMLESKTS
jgi:RNA polymerase sigma-70 factor (ECF subfamily)